MHNSERVKAALTPKLENISTPARRRLNRDLAIRLATHGVPIFPSNGKVPLIPLWTKLDASLTDAERSKAIEKFQAKHGHAPEHVGATIDQKTVRRLWGAIPDAVPSLSCGPAGLLVLDADSKNDGPNKLTQWFEENGRPVDCPITRTQSGGLHVYYRNDPLDPMGSGAGAFRALGTDVRGIGGQVVAPGAIREDGRRYTPEPGTPDLIETFAKGLIPPVPDSVRRAIGERREATVSNAAERAAVERIKAMPAYDFDDLIDPIVGTYDFDALAENNETFRKLLSDPSTDHSANRWALVSILRAEYGDKFLMGDYQVILDGLNTNGAFGEYVDHAPAQGQYDDRAVAREYLKAAQRIGVSDGDSFGAVEEDDAGEAAKDVQPKKAKFELKSFADFAAEYTPLKYVVDGIIVRGSIYTLTAPTGAGKTTLLTPLALAVATGRGDMLGMKVKQGTVVYLTFENPDDYRMKMIAAAKAHNVTSAERFEVGDARVSPEVIFKTLKGAEKEYSMIVVDTLQAAFDGDDFNDNKAILDFVSRLRKLTTLPGKPAVVIAAHPVKNATKDNLIPYGGGAVLNEVDGNLTLWRGDGSDITTLHWQGKFRGAEFAPMDFQIVAPPCEGLLDDEGRVVKPPVIKRASDATVEGSEARTAAETIALLRTLDAEPDAPLARLASLAGFKFPMQAKRRLGDLAKEKLVEKSLTGRFTLTAKGKKALAEAPVQNDEWATAEGEET